MQLNELVNLHFDDLNESDLYIWNYINNHREVCTKITIEDLGKKCNVSRTIRAPLIVSALIGTLSPATQIKSRWNLNV